MVLREEQHQDLKRVLLEERKRISREIHDSVAQNLSYLIMGLGGLQMSLKSETEVAVLEKKVAELTEVAQEACARLRQCLAELRLPCVFKDSLSVCIQEACADFTRTSGLPVQIHVTVVEEELDYRLKHEVMRIVQEALQNVYKHAGASHVTVECIKQGEHLKIRIVDDGIGFEVENVKQGGYGGKGLGLQIMEERTQALGGYFKIISKPGQGTEVFATIPVHFEKEG